MTDTIPVRGGELDAATYRRLAPAAEKLGVSIFALLAELARRQLADLTPPPPAPETEKRTRRPWTAADVEQLLELHGRELSDHAIARAIGRTPSTVSQKRRDLGLQSNYRAFGPGVVA